MCKDRERKSVLEVSAYAFAQNIFRQTRAKMRTTMLQMATSRTNGGPERSELVLRLCATSGSQTLVGVGVAIVSVTMLWTSGRDTDAAEGEGDSDKSLTSESACEASTSGSSASCTGTGTTSSEVEVDACGARDNSSDGSGRISKFGCWQWGHVHSRDLEEGTL